MSIAPKCAEKLRRSQRGWRGVERARLNAQALNKTPAGPEPAMGEGAAEVDAPTCMARRTCIMACCAVRRPWQGRRVGEPSGVSLRAHAIAPSEEKPTGWDGWVAWYRSQTRGGTR